MDRTIDPEQLIAHAYSAYDTDARAHGPDGYAAFHDAVQVHVTQFLDAGIARQQAARLADPPVVDGDTVYRLLRLDATEGHAE
jgi:hypothetical protein